MFESMRNFWRRHRTKIAIGASVLGATYFAGQYVLGKLTEARQRMADDKIARENIRRRFEQNQEDCTYTTLALLPTVTENCMAKIPVQETLQELQARKSEKLARSTASSDFTPSEDVLPGNSDEHGSIGSSGFVHASRMVGDAGQDSELLRTAIQGKTRVQLWNDLKISSVTQAFTLIYTLALLTLFTRIQLNLLGRRNYLSSVVSLATPERQGSGISLENHDDDNLEQDYGNDFETNRKYLTFSWWLLHRGWEAVIAEVESAVRDVFSSVTPRDNITLERLAELTLEVRKRVEGATEEERRLKKWLEYLLPPAGDEAKVLVESGISPGSPPLKEDPSTISPSLKRLLDETSDLIDSPTFSHVITLLLDAGFSLLIDEKVAAEAFQTGSLGTTPRIQEISDESSHGSDATKGKSTKLANVLAAFTRQAPAIGSGGNIGAIMSGTSTEIPGLTGPSIKEANEYLAAMEGVRDLEAFAAVVYSSNFEFEGIDTVGGEQFPIIIPEAGLDDGMIDPEDTLDLTLESAWEKAVSDGDARSE